MHLIKRSQFLNKQKICLEVNSPNISALKLYNKLSFGVAGERKGFYNNNKKYNFNGFDFIIWLNGLEEKQKKLILLKRRILKREFG